MIYNSLDELKNVPDEFWNTPGQILTVKNKNHAEFLSRPTEKVDTIEMAERIASKLILTLNTINKFKRKGFALTANQIGIPASVFVIILDRVLYFINPEIIETSPQKVWFNEGCLSIPRKSCKVQRHLNIKIKADNFSEEMSFGISGPEFMKTEYEKMFEAIVIQHEFDHTQGMLMTDLEDKLVPIKNENKIGRNDKVKIVKDGVGEKEIKYKLFDKFEKEGWRLSIG
jgi:peptide deformylase